MYNWCEAYPLDGPFERWHIIYNFFDTPRTGDSDRPEIPLIQFESKKAAYLFKIAFSEYIIEDRSLYSLYD